MRILHAALAAVFAVALTGISAPEADAQAGGVRAKKAQKSARARPSARATPGIIRRASVGPNGLCQRDNGTPESQLDFRNRCDVEEFWARINERNSDVGR